jgi:hypothetical protein
VLLCFDFLGVRGMGGFCILRVTVRGLGEKRSVLRFLGFGEGDLSGGLLKAPGTAYLFYICDMEDTYG